MGRKSIYTDEIAQEIVERLSKGEPMAAICRDEHMPAVRTVSDWIAGDEQFSASIARAREDGFDALAAQCLDIADDASNDSKLVGGGDDDAGHLVPNSEWISRSKLRVETRLKLLAKWDPKRYGDKVDHNVSGGVTVNIVRFTDVPPE